MDQLIDGTGYEGVWYGWMRHGGHEWGHCGRTLFCLISYVVYDHGALLFEYIL